MFTPRRPACSYSATTMARCISFAMSDRLDGLYFLLPPPLALCSCIELKHHQAAWPRLHPLHYLASRRSILRYPHLFLTLPWWKSRGEETLRVCVEVFC